MATSNLLACADVEIDAIVAVDGPPDNPADDMAVVLGRNLRRLRIRRGLSLERLARLSGVSRAMLGQIELGRSVPTILLLNKVARALDAPLTAFLAADGRSDLSVLRREEIKVVTSVDGGYRARALAPGEGERRLDFYEVRLRPGATDHAPAQAAGTFKNIAVLQGTVELEVGCETTRLREGDAAAFDAGRPHAIRNIGGGEAVFYVVGIPTHQSQ